MRLFKSALVVLFAAPVLSACTDRGVDPIKVQADVAIAQAQGDEKIARAQEALDRARVVVGSAPTNADSVRPTTGTPPTGVDAPGTTMVDIDPARKLAYAQFDLDKAKAEKAYNIALARCGDRAGDANRVCRDSAKAAYEAAENVAKSKISTHLYRKDEP